MTQPGKRSIRRGTSLLLLLLWLQGQPAGAQSGPFVTVTVPTNPPGAAISQQGPQGPGDRRRLGTAGQPVQVDLSRPFREGDIRLVATLDGYCEDWISAGPPEKLQPTTFTTRSLQPRYQKVTFYTDPTGATVLLQVSADNKNPVGKSGEPVQLDREQFRHEGRDTPFEVNFELEGYETPKERIKVESGAWKAGGWPLGGAIKLAPAPGLGNKFVRQKLWATQNPGTAIAVPGVALSLILSALFVWWPKHRTQKEKLERARRLYALEVTSDDPNIKKRIGPYRIVDKLGSGGMATVYKGLPDVTLDENEAVAIKVMMAELAEDPEYRRRFKREVDVSRGLDHRNIVRLIDWGEQDSLLYLVMEMVDGQTLKDSVKEGGLGLEYVLQIIRGIIDGLEHAHGRGIVHRDLKPANVMVTKKGVVKIMDLGLARGTSEAHKVTATGDALGTPAYMPPEQISGGSLTHRSDQYALGCMFYEMLTGHLPFEESDPMRLILKHLQETPTPVQERRPGIPDGIAEVVHRMLAKEPRERFNDMADLRTTLEHACEEGAGGSDGRSEGVGPQEDLTTTQMESPR